MNDGFVIIGQNANSLAYGSKVESLEAGDTAVFINMDSGKQVIGGRYESREQCRFAIGLLLAAEQGDEKDFEFPHKADLAEMMRMHREHRGNVSAKANRHGGS